jgi:CRP-like cAMP-binding protein
VISNERYVHLSIYLTTPLHHSTTPSISSCSAQCLSSIDKTSADIQIMQLVDQAGRQGLRWTAAIRALEQQSSIPIDHSEFAEVVKGLTDEGVVRIVGERERRTIRRLAD